MTNILDGLKADVTDALAGTLRSATLWQYELIDDGYGGQYPGYDTSYPCEGVRGSFDAVVAGLSGIPRTDAQIELLASSLPTTPKALDKVHIEGTWWIVNERQLDPSNAWWVLQCASTEAVP